MFENSKKLTTSKIALYGMFMALTTVSTMIISIPSIATQGYINLGDAFVILSGLVLGPFGGLVVGGIGSALADILLGYAYYAPYTLIIKGLEGLIGVSIYRIVLKEKFLLPPVVVAGLFMALGYLVVEIFLYGYPAAIASLPGNIVQGLVGALISSIIYKAIKTKIKF